MSPAFLDSIVARLEETDSEAAAAFKLLRGYWLRDLDRIDALTASFREVKAANDSMAAAAHRCSAAG